MPLHESHDLLNRHVGLGLRCIDLEMRLPVSLTERAREE
jgi:hypothetical protein